MSYRINEPYNANDGLCYNLDVMTSYKYPTLTEGVLLEFRNDYCSDPNWREKITEILKSALFNRTKTFSVSKTYSSLISVSVVILSCCLKRSVFCFKFTYKYPFRKFVSFPSLV